MDKPVKQVIVFRKDLLKGENGIRKGKFAGQVAHASLMAFLSHFNWEKKVTLENGVYEGGQESFSLQHDERLGGLYSAWLLSGLQTKVVVGVENEEELMKLYNEFADDEKFPCLPPLALVTDAGKTEFHGKPTVTCFAVGPWMSEDLDKITGHLKLL